MMKKSLLLAACAAVSMLAACSNAGVQRRQDALSGTQAGVLENRATRLEARDQRMNASRDVWLQD